MTAPPGTPQPPPHPPQPASESGPARRSMLPSVSLGDALFRLLCQAGAVLVIVLALLLVLVLLWKSWLAIDAIGARFFATQTWDPEPSHRQFGALAFIYGTVVTSAIAMLIAVPLGVGTAVFLSEIAPPWLQRAGSFLVEMLAAVPSVVYGFWGLFVMVPALGELFTALGVPNQSGLGLFSTGLILSIMIVPYVAAVSYDVCKAVPRSQREASLALGASRWQTIWSVLLPYARPGIVGGCFIALGRALGETMAVTMVIGNRPEISLSPFGLGDSIASVIANQFTEATYDLYLSALVELGLVLLLVSIVVNSFARVLILRISRPGKGRGLFDLVARRAWLVARNNRAESAARPSTDASGMARATRPAPRATIATAAPVSARASWVNRLMTGGSWHGHLFGLGIVAAVTALGLAVDFLVPEPTLRLVLLSLLGLVGFVVALVTLGVLGLCLLITVGPLFLILGHLIYQGVEALNWQFFVNLPAPVGEPGGGMANALYGSLLLVGLATAFAVPIGLLAAIYLAEYRSDRLGPSVRFIGELLGGVPSIVIGIFAYTLVVKPMGHFSGWAGGFALGVMMVPIVMRASEEALKLVPRSIRHASYALGASQWQTVLRVSVPAALPAIITAVFLGIARIAGETAPLLLTASSNQYWPTSPNDFTPSLPVFIFNYAVSPYEDWHRQAWAAALVLLVVVMVLNVGVRLVTGRRLVQASRAD
jgi:phosphate transport system permease protein